MSPKRTIPNQSNFISDMAESGLAVRNLKVVTDFAEGSPFARKGYAADAWKFFVEFDVCNTLPGVWAGPTSAGNYIGFIGESLAASHAGLRFQQFNFRHQLKAYAAESEKGGKRDRIIGAIVDTAMDSRPAEGWWSPSNPKGAETCIHAIAVVWKLADGIADIIGGHLTGTQEQGVSIEVTTEPANLAVLRMSTMELQPYADVIEGKVEAWKSAIVPIPEQQRPAVGSVDGEQLIVLYGPAGDPISFKGVGMTPNPAEVFMGTRKPAAVITDVNCEASAAAVPSLLVNRRVRFSTGRMGRVHRVITEGMAGGFRAGPEPVLECRLDLTGAPVFLPWKRAAAKIL